MSMKVTRLYTHCTPEQAQTLIEFIDHLRDQLWECYGDQIVSLLREASDAQNIDGGQDELDFDDDIDF